MRLLCWFFTFIITFHLHSVNGFADYLLKKCDAAGFCHRNREYANNIQNSSASYYSLPEDTIQYNEKDNILRGTIHKTIPKKESEDIVVKLPFTLSILQNASVRFTIDELRVNSSALPEVVSQSRYNETYKWAFDRGALLTASPAIVKKRFSWFDSTKFTVTNKAGNLKVVISKNKLLIEIYHNQKLSMTVNERLFLNIEHLRSKEENFRNLLPEESSFNMFKDNFEHSKGDSLPFGPESVALDFAFKGSCNVFGIPEHADSLRLRDTSNGEPYRLYNVDVFEYNVNSTSPMYGAIPFMMSSSPQSTAGIFWVNAADTWVDIKYVGEEVKTHWISESGIIDVVLFFGETPSDVIEKYTGLTGRPTLPSLGSIGYHQCRWNYNDELDVLTVDSELDRAHVPYDYIWLDLEYTDEKKFFTWQQSAFPYPERLLQRLARLGRQLVILIDPHIKVGYEISKTIVEKGAAIRDSTGNTFFGECWPGTSVWIDTFGEKAQKLWGKFFQKLVKAANLHIWNDMNEPSIFSGPETTAPKDLLHEGGFEERSVHNLYGLTVHQSTYLAMKEIFSKEDLRPFILTRAFFAGSQRTAATWTGDNVASWDYLKISIPMCLTNNVAGMPFIGADIAGFSGDPEDELIVRWYQAGLWYPFFRAHAHIDSKRREPYLLREPVKSLVRDSIQLRYSLLPTFYGAFHKASVNGNPIMKPMFFEKPDSPQLYAVDDQFYLGDSGIIVKPVTEPNVSEVELLLAPGVYYDFYTLEEFIINTKEDGKHTSSAGLATIPIILEGGHIVTKKDKYRRSSKLLRNDPFSLVVAPDANGKAFGEVYIDDGETFAYQRGHYLESEILLSNGRIKNILKHRRSNNDYLGNTNIEKIIIAVSSNKIGCNKTAKVILGSESHNVDIILETDNIAMILNPSVKFDEPWEIIL